MWEISCRLWGLRVWTCIIRTRSVRITWELVRNELSMHNLLNQRFWGVDPANCVFTYLPLRGFWCSLKFKTCCSSWLWGKRPFWCYLDEGGKHVWCRIYAPLRKVEMKTCRPQRYRNGGQRFCSILLWTGIYVWETLSYVHMMPSVTAVVDTGRPEDLEWGQKHLGSMYRGGKLHLRFLSGTLQGKERLTREKPSAY